MNPVLQKILIHSSITIVALLLGFFITRALLKSAGKNAVTRVLAPLLIIAISIHELTGFSGAAKIDVRVFLMSFVVAALLSFYFYNKA